MSEGRPENPSREQRLEQVLVNYLRSEEQGRPLDQKQLLAQHPDLADDLESFFRFSSSEEFQVGTGADPLNEQPNCFRLSAMDGSSAIQPAAYRPVSKTKPAADAKQQKLVGHAPVIAHA